MAIGGQNKRRLYEMVKKLDLVEFIAKETGTQPVNMGNSWNMICPMPSHKDSKPSFNIHKKAGTWYYICYGCDSKGTIVDFCVDYRSYIHPSEALIYIIERHGIKTDAEFMMKAVKEAKVECDKKIKIETSHFLASSNCRRLLRRYNGDEKIQAWVAEAYRNMNNMLEADDLRAIEKVSDKACNILINGLKEDI